MYYFVSAMTETNSNKNLFVLFAKEVYKEVLAGNFGAIKNIKYYKKWKDSQEPGKNAISDEQPWISFPVIDFLEKQVNRDSIIFEYGGGGSTFFFINRAKEVVTVEHHEGWFEKLQEKMKNKGNTNWSGNLILPEKHPVHLDLDPAEPSHYYTNEEPYIDSTFKKYATYIDRFPDKYFDIVLVDGRSRPSCIWHSMKKIKTHGFLIVDNINRKHYFTQLEKLKEQFEVLHQQKAAGPYALYFTKTGVWQKT